jgi:hypothetical protein
MMDSVTEFFFASNGLDELHQREYSRLPSWLLHDPGESADQIHRGNRRQML